MIKFLLLSVFTCSLGITAFAQSNAKTDVSSKKKLSVAQAVGYYQCSGRNKGVLQELEVEIYVDTETNIAVVDWSKEEASGQFEYSKVSFSVDQDQVYFLKLGRVNFECSKI